MSKKFLQTLTFLLTVTLCFGFTVQTATAATEEECDCIYNNCLSKGCDILRLANISKGFIGAVQGDEEECRKRCGEYKMACYKTENKPGWDFWNPSACGVRG